MTDADVRAAARLYDAMAALDPAAILDALTEDFVGDVAEGMPLGVGGRHDGREAMLREVWGVVFQHYAMRLEVERYLPCGDGEVVVLGRYVGEARDGGVGVDAGFAHVLAIRDDRIAALRQITDTARWGRRAAGAGAGAG